jgi:hypothetical protein
LTKRRTEKDLPVQAGQLVLVIVLALLAGAVAAAAVRTLRTPLERWTRGKGRWMLFSRAGEQPPRSRELRFWAGVWLFLAVVVLGIAVAIALV